MFCRDTEYMFQVVSIGKMRNGTGTGDGTGTGNETHWHQYRMKLGLEVRLTGTNMKWN